MDILLDTYTWFALSFLLFAVIVYKFGGPKIAAALDHKILQIKKDLETAETLRKEAHDMLALYQIKQKDAALEAEKIISDAKIAAQKIQESAEQEFLDSMHRREQQLSERLMRIEQNARQEIQDYTANLALEAIRQLVQESLDKNLGTKLIDQSIQTIDQNIH